MNRSSAAPERAGLWFLAALPAAAVAMSAMHVVSRHRLRTLVADQWNIYGDYLTGDPFAALIAATNGHRLVVPGLAILADLHLSGGDNFVLHWVAILSALGTVVLFSRAAFRTPELSEPVWVGLASICISLVFWLGNRDQFTSPINGVANYPLLALFLASFLCFHRAVSRNDGDAQGREGRVLMLALVLALLANFTFGIGNVVWPVLLAGCILLRVRKRVALACASGFALCLILYLTLPDSAGIRAGREFGWERLGRSILFAITFCGSVAGHWIEPMTSARTPSLASARVAGALGMAVAGFALGSATLRPRKLGALEFASLCLMLVGIGTGLLIGLTRSYFQDGVEGRYLLWSAAFWIGLAGWVACHLKTPRGRAAFAVVALALPFALAPSHLIFADRAVTRMKQTERATLSFRVGPRDETDARALIGWPFVTTPLHQLMPVLRERHLSLFADAGHDLMGRDGRALYATPGLRQCPTQRLRFVNDSDSDPPAVRILGSLEGGKLGGSLVVVTDASGTVVGLGQVPARNQLTLWGFPRPLPPQSFAAFARAGEASPYSGYVVSQPSGPAQCRIGPFQRR